MIRGFRYKHRFHHTLQRRAILHPLPVGGKARVLAPFRVPERFGAALPDRLAGGADHQIAVLCPHALVGRILPTARALAVRRFVVGEPLGACPRTEADCGLEQRAFDGRPRPVRWRSYRAARMPCTAHMPVPRSQIRQPDRGRRPVGLVGHRRPIIFDQHVHAIDKAKKQRAPFRLLVIKGDALLVRLM
jgi:hypothetical protein